MSEREGFTYARETITEPSILDLLTHLCTLKPDNFKHGHFAGGIFFEAPGMNWVYLKCPDDTNGGEINEFNVGSACWWLLEQMPKGTFLDFMTGSKRYRCRALDENGFDVGAHPPLGVGRIRSEAVIRAFIAWAEAGKPGRES